MITEDSVKQALHTVRYPGFSRDIVSFGIVKKISANGGAVSVHMDLNSSNTEAAQQIKTESERALRALGATNIFVEVKTKTAATPSPGTAAGTPNPFAQQNRMPGVRHVVAVASGKGGVGKSTVSVNLSCALKQLGARVGLLDCDIYGPSIPLMMGVNEKPTVSEDEKLVPPQNYGIKLMSMGFLIEGDNPVIWRGPMITKTIQQFITTVAWGELDYLLVDLPPGTGDAQLSLCQTVPLDGGVIVTTPQEASLGVVRKGIGMFHKVNVPILGIVENMSYFTTPNGERVEIFGHGGGKAESARQDVPFLGEIPLYTEIREGGDRGVPVTMSNPNSAPAQSFIQIAKTLQAALQ